MTTLLTYPYVRVTDLAFRGYNMLLPKVQASAGMKDGNGVAIVSGCAEGIGFRDEGDIALILDVDFEPTSELVDIMWMRFKAHLYALYTDCIEDIRRNHTVREGKNLIIAVPTTVTHEHVFDSGVLTMQLEIKEFVPA